MDLNILFEELIRASRDKWEAKLKEIDNLIEKMDLL